MDPDEFTRELARYRVVRSRDWRRDWAGEVDGKQAAGRTRSAAAISGGGQEVRERCSEDADQTPRGGEKDVEDFFQGIVQVLRGAYGRETGNKIATAFKMKYFEDIDKLSLEVIEDIAEALRSKSR